MLSAVCFLLSAVCCSLFAVSCVLCAVCCLLCAFVCCVPVYSVDRGSSGSTGDESSQWMLFPPRRPPARTQLESSSRSGIRGESSRLDLQLSLRVFVDHSMVEVYADGGRGVVTSRVYAPIAADGIQLVADYSHTTSDHTGSTHVTATADVNAWPLNSCWLPSLV
jgi:hypothetical protein